jgi:WD40 repeat protein
VASASDDRTIKLWDAQTGKLQQTLSGHAKPVLSVSFSPDGQLLASAGSDRTVRVWDAQTGALRQTLTGHEHSVSSALFSPSGKLIASCGADASVRLWEAGGGRLLATLMILPGARMDETSNEWIAFTPEGRYTGSTEAKQSIRWRAGDVLFPSERYERDFNRPESVQQAIQSGR